MNAEELARWRMRTLGLSGSALGGPEDVVRQLGAVQSQEFGLAKWAVGQRTEGLADAAVDGAFQAGAFLRTHVLRPTWHFVLPTDIRWMLELTAPRVRIMIASYDRQLELDAAVLNQCTTALVGALEGGRQITRKQAKEVLASAGIETGVQRLGHILMHLELNGLICSGVMSGKQQTYALLEERAPAARSLTRDEALAELTLRYFTSHGPASAKDFRWWSSLTLAEIKRGLDIVAPQLEEAMFDGVTYWFSPAGMVAPPEPSPTVHLLKAFDEYIVGYSQTRYVIDAARAARTLPLTAGAFIQLIVIDSQAAGFWRRTLTKHGVVVEAALFRPLDDAETLALQAAADAHGSFLGLPATVVTTLIGQG